MVDPDVVIGTLVIFGMDACVLIDPGSTHSYISAIFAARVGEAPSDLDQELVVSTLVGRSIVCSQVYRDCGILVHGHEMPADLVLLPL